MSAQVLRTVLVLATAVLFAAPPLAARQGTAPQATASGLQRLLQAELERVPGLAGIHVKHLTTGEEAAVRGDEAFNSASVIKIPAMILAYQMAARGELDLSQRVEVRKADVRGGSGIYRNFDLGLQPTLRDVIRQMIVTSDNTATDLVGGKVGGVAAVNRWLRANGFPTSELTQTINETFRARYEALDPALRTLTPEDVYAIGTSNPAWGTSPERVRQVLELLGRPGVSERMNALTREERATWVGAMTPRETSGMLEGIEKARWVPRAASDEMLGMLRQQLAGARRLPHYLTIPVAHKTGDFAPMLANDVGILYAPSGPIVVSFFSNAIRGNYGEAEDRIGEVARLIVEYFEGR
jgi:beta-lactamase class A